MSIRSCWLGGTREMPVGRSGCWPLVAKSAKCPIASKVHSANLSASNESCQSLFLIQTPKLPKSCLSASFTSQACDFSSRSVASVKAVWATMTSQTYLLLASSQNWRKKKFAKEPFASGAQPIASDQAFAWKKLRVSRIYALFYSSQ